MKLIKFGAEWCGPCKVQSKEFKEHPIDCELKEVDINSKEGEDLVPKYKVRSLPTMVLLNDDNSILVTWCKFTKSEIINEFIHRRQATPS